MHTRCQRAGHLQMPAVLNGMPASWTHAAILQYTLRWSMSRQARGTSQPQVVCNWPRPGRSTFLNGARGWTGPADNALCTRHQLASYFLVGVGVLLKRLCPDSRSLLATCCTHARHGAAYVQMHVALDRECWHRAGHSPSCGTPMQDVGARTDQHKREYGKILNHEVRIAFHGFSSCV